MRHLLNDPAFPDLVAAVAEEDFAERRPGYACRGQSCAGSPMPDMIAEALRLLARLW